MMLDSEPMDDEDSQVGKLEEVALKRKQKIAELRAKRKLAGQELEHQELSGESKVELPKPKFRSYKPQDSTLQESTLPLAKPENVGDHVKDVLDNVTDQPIADDIDLTKLAPRKIDWDLKRNIAKKWEKLERRTQIAIAELIRERLLASKDTIENLDKATEDLDAANRNTVENDDDDD